MFWKRFIARRALLIVLVVTLLFVQFAIVVPLPAVAEGPTAGQAAPLNPDFEAWLQNRNVQAVQPAGQSPQSAVQGTQTAWHPLGLVPRSIDLRHLNRIPVTAAARAQSQAMAGPQAASAGAQTAGSGTVGLPASFDWRAQGKVTPVRDQSSCGTCWAFGTMASFESRTWIQAGSQNDFSEQNLVCCTDPSWTYLPLPPKGRCSNGGWDFIAVDTLIKKGARLETCDPYNTSTINTEACRGCDTSYKATGFRTVCETAAGNEAAIKDAIYNFGPVEAAFYYSGGTVYSGYIIHNPGSGSWRNHLICIVGWDDSFSYGGTTGAWIIKNSWGTSAGQDGYYYMTYGSSNLGDVGYFASVSAVDPNETIYYYDEAGMVNDWGYPGSSSAWMASVFTATQAGRLNAADFWTTSNNAQYVIYVYNGQFGSVLATQTGTCAEQGYYSIPLTTAVNLNAGQQFTVAVKMTTPGHNYPLPIEQVSYYCSPIIQTGVSFAKRNDGDAWTDLGSTQHYNVCLRARINRTTTVPSAPVLNTPSGGASVSGTSITFTWSPGTGSPNNYWLYVNSSAALTGTNYFQGSVGNVTSQVVSGLPNNGSPIYWTLQAGNACGWSSGAGVRSFVNGGCAVPQAPTLNSPDSGAIVSDTSITLSWSPGTGNPTNYWLYVNSSPSLNGISYYQGGVGNVTSRVVSGLPNNGSPIYWTLQAGNACGWSPGAGVRSFTNGL